jgi:hypothetical protein
MKWERRRCVDDKWKHFRSLSVPLGVMAKHQLRKAKGLPPPEEGYASLQYFYRPRDDK